MKFFKVMLLSIGAVCMSNSIHTEASASTNVFMKEEIPVPVSSKHAAETYIRSQLLQRTRMIRFQSSNFIMTTDDELKDFVFKVARQRVAGNSTAGDYLRHIIEAGYFSVDEVSEGTYRYTMQILYKETVEETNVVDKKIAAPVKKVKKMPAYKRAKYLAEWVVKYLQYDYNYFGSYNTAYEAVQYGRSKCMGYVMLTQKLFSSAGLKCKVVLGTVPGRGNHAWNAVKIGKKWYYVDTCWMDSYGGTKANLKYFLFGQKTCKKERTILSGYSVKGISKKDYGEKKYKTTPSRIYLQ